jgi:predicted RNA-binding Zn ribbon-like protein
MPDQALAREAGAALGFAALAGHRALDLVNTVGWRLDPDRRHERLADDAAALTWIAMFEVCDDAELDRVSRAPAGALGEGLRSVRELIYAAAFEGRVADATALLALDREWLDRVELVPRPVGGWAVRESDVDERTPALRLAHETVKLLIDLPAPVKQCADDACGWIYLDTSPRRNRRWCAAEDCGARNRSRSYYRRHRPAEADTAR